MWHSAQRPSGPRVRDCWLPLFWMSERFLVLPRHCPLSCPLATARANCYPTVAFHLCHQVAMGAQPTPRWPAGCYQARSTTLFPFAVPSFVYNGFSTLSGSEDELLMYLSPMGCHVSPPKRQIHEGWHHWVKACALWISALLLRRVCLFGCLFVCFLKSLVISAGWHPKN